jgi:hypothetical protein
VTAITTGHDSARIGVGGWVVPAAGAGSGSARIAATGAAGSSRLMRPGHPCGTRHRKDSSLGDKIGDHGEHRRCALYRERGSIRMILTVKAAHAAAQAPAPVFPVVFALASVRKILAVPRIGTCDRQVAPPDDGESHAMRVHLVRHETRRWRDVPGSGASHPTRVSVRCSPCSEACETRRCCLSLELWPYLKGDDLSASARPRPRHRACPTSMKFSRNSSRPTQIEIEFQETISIRSPLFQLFVSGWLSTRRWHLVPSIGPYLPGRSV